MRPAAVRAIGWAVALTPLVLSLTRGASGGLGQQLHMTAELGTWSLRFLVGALAAPAAAALLNRPALGRLARDLGLAGFVYAAAHVTAVCVVGRIWEWSLADLAARADFLPGLAALLLLLPAAAISVPPFRRGAPEPVRRRILAWAGAAAPLAALHYAMPVGLEVAAPYLYGGAALALVTWSAVRRRRSRS